MLAELRANALSPKSYYELYMAAFDQLRVLGEHLADLLPPAHNDPADGDQQPTANSPLQPKLSDLYEFVQYVNQVVPRLYLMVTVGSVYMRDPAAPRRELMLDLLEMCRGVQHPTRGIFLLHETIQLRIFIFKNQDYSCATSCSR